QLERHGLRGARISADGRALWRARRTHQRRHAEAHRGVCSLRGAHEWPPRDAALPRIEPPPDLPRRILAAGAAATPKVVPFRGRMARAVSLAGNWAMRP